MEVKINHIYSHEWDEYKNVEKIDNICKGLILTFQNKEKLEISTEDCCIFIEEKKTPPKTKTKGRIQ